MAKKIVVDLDLCEGNELCARAAPGLFRIGADEKARVTSAVVSSAEEIAIAERAAFRCPRRAIKLLDA